MWLKNLIYALYELLFISLKWCKAAIMWKQNQTFLTKIIPVCAKKKREIKKGWLCIYCECGKMFFDLASRDSTVDSIIRDFWLLLAWTLSHSSYTLPKFLSHCSLKWDQHSTPLFIFWMFNVLIFFMARQLASQTAKPIKLVNIIQLLKR